MSMKVDMEVSTHLDMKRNLGEEWQFSNSSIKPYPACRYSGGNIDACLELTKKYDIIPEEIESIVFASQVPQIENIMLPVEEKKNPQNMVEMQHSLPYCGAIALVNKRFNVNDLDLKNLEDPLIKRLMEITTYKIDEELDSRYPESYSTSVIVTTKDGNTYKSIIDYPLGDWRNPVSEEFIISKFKDLASNGIDDAERLNNIVDYVLNIEKKENISDLMDMINFVN